MAGECVYILEVGIDSFFFIFYFYFFDISLSIDIFFKDGVSKFLTQVHMRPKAHPVCLKAQRFVVILSAHK